MGFDLVLLGGTGDLAWRKLLPALFQAFRHGSLPEGGRIIGVAREAFQGDTQYREWVAQRLADIEGEKRPTPEEFARFAALLHYVRADLSNPADYAALAERLHERPADSVVLYLATAPALFATVAEQLGRAGLATPHTRIVLEKPLGHDLASNRAINTTVLHHFAEHQVFRIDHYLGKPSVQNLLALRFGNALFEPLWRRDTIASIQITMAETLGVEKRASLYDGIGALRDMVQNHALQLLCAVAMEPPVNASADAIRDEKLKVLRSLRPWTPDTVARDVVRGQYTAGQTDGQRVLGYQQEAGVGPDSRTETFVALRTEIDNWRWAGVPFYLRTGKRLAAREAFIVVNFRPAPHAIFRTPEGAANRLVIHLQPRDGLDLHLFAAAQAPHQPAVQQAIPRLSAVSLNMDFEQRFGAERVGAYERLLLDVLAGRLNLFVRSDEQEAAWQWVEPILHAWQHADEGPRGYACGTWGPSAASALVARDGHCWTEEC
ncbi:MAG: glucose-6-phosphate dehydrogenase [Simplicispira sp.]|nr:glucose-6-phosphate dehydrogenase [Simplicispira sp.]